VSHLWNAVDEEAPTSVFARSSAPSRQAPTRASHDGLWNVADVARFLKVSRSWVYHRAEAGLLPCVRIGSLLRFNPEIVRGVANGDPAGAPVVGGSHGRRR
jgi:predicted DNA-binding transcriptional regulator AlpA